jgi:hypothetical protein
MNFSIHNLSPDSDVVHIVLGDNPGSIVSISISRDESGEVEILLTDNMDNSTRKLILGKPGFSEHSDFGEE